MKSVVVLLAFVAIAFGSHGRFGTIKFVKSPSDPLTITATFDAVFRRTYFGAPNVGNTINDGQAWTWGDGSSASPTMTVTEINTAEDWVVVKWTATKRYASAGTYQMGWASCCRIFALANNPSYSYAHFATIVFSAAEVAKSVSPNNSPVSSMLPIVEVPLNVVPFQYNIRATDPENDVLTYSMASPAQQGDGNSIHPPGLSVNSATGVVTLSSALGQGYWTTQQIVKDPLGNWVSIDYILNVQPKQTYCNGLCIGTPNPKCVSDADCATCNTTCVEALPRLITNDISSGVNPSTNLPSPTNLQTFNRNVGQQVVVNFVADDANLRNPQTGVTIYASSTPAGSVLSNQVQCTTANGCQCVGCNALPQLRTLTWTPTSADLGSNTICVGVKSLANYLPYSQHCITINVIALPITSGAMTTQPLTTSELTTQPLTTQELTTSPVTSQPLTTELLTTESLTTQSLTTSFATVAARCATYNMAETQGFYCAADHSGYYQCLKGPWAAQSNYRPCAPGTTCKCEVGVECSTIGLCSAGAYTPTTQSAPLTTQTY